MPQRTRNRDLRQQRTGTQYYVGFSPPSYTATNSCWNGLRETCTDWVDRRDQVNPFVLDSVFTNYPLLNGELFDDEGDLVMKFTDFPIADQPTPSNPANYWGGFNTALLNQYAWEILAGTNPSLPHVSVPTMLGELKDIPSLVKGWGESLLKSAAKANLTWRWALRPMISDLQKLMRFQQAVEDRLKMLRALRDGKTLRRRCHLDSGRATTVNETNHGFHLGFGVSLRGPLKRTFTKKVWGTAQWKLKPDNVLPTLGYREMDTLAKRLASGITTHEALAAAWELTPWSWLADWFGNVGDLIAATNNSVGLTWSHLALMRTLTSVVDAKVNREVSTTWVTLNSDYVLTWTRKERWSVFPVIPFPLPTLPILTAGKLSILASLAALRR